ncbi:hypothetical protein ACI7RC_11840 [Brevibacillus sp. B_LB10_24]
MEILFVILILIGMLTIYDAIRKLNANIMTQIDQNDKIIELLQERNSRN